MDSFTLEGHMAVIRIPEKSRTLADKAAITDYLTGIGIVDFVLGPLQR